MSNANNNVQISFGTSGLTRVLGALNRLSQAGQRINGAFTRDISRVASVAGTAAGAVGGIGVAAAALGAGSLAGFVSALNAAKQAAKEVSEELELTSTRAAGAGIEDANRFAGLVFAAQQAGIEDAETVVGAMAGLQAGLLDVADESEGMLTAFEALNARYEDFFTTDGEILDGATIFRNMSKRIDALPDDTNIAQALLPILGETDAFEFARFFELGSAEIEKFIQSYEQLTDVRDIDFELARSFRRSQTELQAGFFGLRNAFARGLFPDLSQSNQDFTKFTVEIRRQAERLGKSVGTAFAELTPRMIEATRLAGALLEGRASDLEDTPLKRAFVGIGVAVSAVSQGFLDILDYLATGETDAPWLVSTLETLQKISLAFDSVIAAGRSVADFFDDYLKPAFVGLNDIFSSVYEWFGVNEKPAQFALTAGLIAFSGTIATTIGLLGSLTSALVAAGAAAGSAALAGAGAAGGALSGAAGVAVPVAAAVGTGFALSSVYDLEESVAQATERAKLIAEEEGEAAGAAYLKTFIEAVAPQNRTANILNDALSKVPLLGRLSADFDGSSEELQVLIDQGSAEQAASGMSQALADFGLVLNAQKQHELTASLNIADLNIADGVARSLDQLNANLAASIDVRVPDVEAPPAAPAKTPISISLFPGTESFELFGDEDTAKKMMIEMRKAQRASLG